MQLLVVGPDFALGRNRAGTIERAAQDRRRAGLRGGGRAAAGRRTARRSAPPPSARRWPRATWRRWRGCWGGRSPCAGRSSRAPSAAHGLGFPTANIAIGLDRALPAFGVYVTRAYVREGAYQSCTNIGVRPTFDVEPRPTVETFILDFDGDIYGQELRIELLHRLRGELKFDSVDELVAQMHRDIDATRAYFRAHQDASCPERRRILIGARRTEHDQSADRSRPTKSCAGSPRRAVAEIVPERSSSTALRSGQRLRLKMGFDPTKPVITLGWAVGLRKLRQLQDLGHTVVLIVGDWTARIGDPSGQSADPADADRGGGEGELRGDPAPVLQGARPRAAPRSAARPSGSTTSP